MSKKYRLLKDLPDTDAGTLLHHQDGMYYYKTRTGEDRWFKETLVENNPTWFEEVEEKAKCGWVENTVGKDGKSIFTLYFNKELRLNDATPIKQAVESVLNGENGCVVCGLKIKAGAKYCADHWRSYSPLKYTQSDIDEARLMAFNAARKLVNGGVVTGYFGKSLVYDTIDTYLQTINDNKK